MNRIKVKKSTIDLILLCIIIYEFSFLPHFVYIGVKYVVLAYLLVTYLKKIPNVEPIIFPLLLYGGVICYSTITNKAAINQVVAGFVYSIQILLIFLVVSVYTKRYGIDMLLHNLFCIFFLFAICSDILMLFVPYNFENPAEEYLIGSKFAISYLHVFLSILYFYEQTNKHKKVIKPLLFLLFAFAICMKVNCTTGMVMCVIVVILFYLPDWLKGKLELPLSIFAILAALNILIFGSISILETGFVQHIVTDILNKTYTFRGRLIIYSKIFDIIKEKMLFGYGYYSSIVDRVVSFGNAQNGVLKIIIDSGIVGLIGFCGVVLQSLRLKDRHACRSIELWPVYCFCYAMVFASTVEINLTNMLFYFSIGIIFSYNSLGARYSDSNL